jgi:hypothetical protein
VANPTLTCGCHRNDRQRWVLCETAGRLRRLIAHCRREKKAAPIYSERHSYLLAQRDYGVALRRHLAGEVVNA